MAREPGIRGTARAVWWYWRRLRGAMAEQRRNTYADQRAKGSNRFGAALYAFMASRLMDWPKPVIVKALSYALGGRG